jgi:hypothetical protein
MPLNVLGTELKNCCNDPVTGFYRDGYCRTGQNDTGRHVICAEMTQGFLEFTFAMGNDLMTARPELHFPGLKPGDKWCLCALRWKEALAAGMAPPVDLESTHVKALDYVTMDQLRANTIKDSGEELA